MSSLPTLLGDRKFVGLLFKENSERWFFEPRHWRLAPRDVKEIDIQFLNFSPPQYDFSITVTMQDGQTMQFYEGVVAKKTVEKAERLYGSEKIGRSNIYFVDGYTSQGYVQTLLEAWCRRKELGALGFTGRFMGISDEAHIHLEKPRPLSKPGQEATTNYLYRYRGRVETDEQKLGFDVVAKRFLPREPLTRGNNEYAMLQVLPSGIVPRIHGALLNRHLKVNDGSQVLVLFTDYIEGAVEVGKQIWDLMNHVSKKKAMGKIPRSTLRRLDAIVQQSIDVVVFPFHRVGFETWHSAGAVIKPGDEYYKWYHRELEQNLAALKAAKAITANRGEILSRIFQRAWNRILSRVKATEIHRDLMWRQILNTKDERLIILDLDEHVAGHAGKDLADLCAANRFIVEDLHPANREYMVSIAEHLNMLILRRYLQNAEKTKAVWAEDLERTVKVYLAYRHLHDAAYYAPVWREAREPSEIRKYQQYVAFSLRWLEKSIKLVDGLLQ